MEDKLAENFWACRADLSGVARQNEGGPASNPYPKTLPILRLLI
jgi:hypothetical protein